MRSAKNRAKPWTARALAGGLVIFAAVLLAGVSADAQDRQALPKAAPVIDDRAHVIPTRPQQKGRAEARPSPPRDSAPRIDIEATYYHQPALVQSALKALKPRQKGEANLYFVGFASFAGQDVFRREVTATRELFDRSFGTRGHSLLLINHRETVADVPLASASNLEAVLKGVGAQMDAEEDVLFLFLTSHGSEGLLAVDFGRFFLNDLTPDRLDTAIQGAGIRNAVIVVSACHSGSFVPALRGMHRLVIAAARADRTSFGCSSERSWTYFGDAYFNHALRETASFTAAFDRAKALVGEWEKAEKFTPSEPQISIGSAVLEKLDQIARRASNARSAGVGE